MANRPHILLTITMLAWGGNAVAGKLAVGHVSPMMLTFGRWSLAIVFIWLLAWREVRKDWPVIRANLPYLLLMGMVGYTLFNALFYTAANYTSGINLALEQAAIPLFIFIGNLLVFRIATTSRQMIGFGLTVIGVILTVTHGNPLNLMKSGLNFGDFLMLIAVLIYAGYSIALKSRPEMHWKSFFTIMVTSAFITSIPFAAWEIASDKVIYPFGLQGALVVLYAAILPSIVSQIFFILAVEKLGANISGLYINLVPIFGTLLSVLILGEPLGWHHGIALLLVTGGIVYAQTGARKA
ncbi:MAG: DMT family transporter [Phyllobacteriaceae bacterium]|nr:DMT family transporter [Phyllobacteriaceae bacterium]